MIIGKRELNALKEIEAMCYFFPSERNDQIQFQMKVLRAAGADSLELISKDSFEAAFNKSKELLWLRGESILSGKCRHIQHT